MNSNKKKKPHKIVSCGTVTWREKEGRPQILLIMQSTNDVSWGIPKGHIESGETFEACAVRETLEETGVLVVPTMRLHDSIISTRNIRKRVITFLAKPVLGSDIGVGGDPDGEIVNAEWFDIDEVPPVFPYIGNVIKSAVQIIRSAVADR